ncbi:MAG TPA: PAS domain S-box protein [Thermoanaerobaculia bacterium]|nr:PAS domain S-box protein [Thermoanaerobaculia bacterium]
MKVLLVEDPIDDALLLEEYLRDAGLEPEIVRVDTAPAMKSALGGEIDVVVSDYNVPGFGGRAALELLRESGRDAPLIVLSGTIGEERAVEMMRAGAKDYVMKENLRRLVPVIHRELEEAAARRRQRVTEELLQEMQERFQATFEQAGVGIAHLSPEGRFIDVNETFAEMLGCSPVEIVGTYAFDWMSPADHAASAEAIAALRHGRVTHYTAERTMLRRDGSPIEVSITASSVAGDGGVTKYLIATFEDITARKRAAALVRHKASLLAASLEATRDAIVVLDFGWRIVEFNRRFLQMFRVDDDVLAKLDGKKALAAALGNVAGRDELARTIAVLQTDGEAIQSGSCETLDGRIIDWYTAPQVLEGRAVGRVWSARDVTARVRAQNERERLAVAVEQAAEMIVIADAEGAIEYVNPAFERITGYRRAEAVGMAPDWNDDVWSTIRGGAVWRGRFTKRRKNGSVLEGEATISPVRDASAAIVNYVAIERDVTQELALAEQLRHAQRIEAIGSLAGGVAHDFNNLLQGMLTLVQLLQSRKADTRRRGTYLGELESTVRRGTQLTRQLLLFARREASRRERLDLCEVLRELAKLLRRVVRENIELTIEIGAEPLPVDADRGQLEQVLVNLVTNASDAMPDGGSLSVRAGRDGAAAWIEVTDTGIGIPESLRQRIFEPFFTTKERDKGTGLGLSVVHGIVMAHNGVIDVTSGAEGTTFRVRLPLLSGAMAVAPARVAAEALPLGSGERVLLVEDEAAVREGLSMLIETLGYNVAAVRSGEDALALEAPAPFALVVTDCMLPGMPGIDFVRRLRERWPDVRAILMSGYTAPDVIDRGVKAGEFAFLQKPFEMNELARTIHVALDGAG